MMDALSEIPSSHSDEVVVDLFTIPTNGSNSSQLDSRVLNRTSASRNLRYVNSTQHVNPRDAIRTSHADYPVTVTLLLIIHLLFFYQWNTKLPKKRVLVSYRQCVQKRQYHKAVVAFLSHPSKIPRPSNSNTTSSSQPTTSLLPTFSSTVINGIEQRASPRAFQIGIDSGTRIRAAMSRYIPASLKLGGSLSGLPLLFYNTHIIWQCRSLEVWYSNDGSHPWQYARVLVSLTVVAVASEMLATYAVLETLRSLGHGTSSPILIDDRPTRYRQRLSRSRSTFARQKDRFLMSRQMGSLAVTATALLHLYGQIFPHGSYPIFPMLPEGLPLLSNPTLSFVLCLGTLLGLSFPTHTITPVVFGSVSGYLWSIGVTSFLKEAYWGNGLIMVVLVSTFLSLKVNGHERWLPCIEHVSWDSEGYDLDPLTGQRYELNDTASPEDSIGDREPQESDDTSQSDTSSYIGDHSLEHSFMDDEPDIEISERRPLHSQDGTNRISSMRNRIPVIGEMEHGDEEEVPRYQEPGSNIRSRRNNNR